MRTTLKNSCLSLATLSLLLALQSVTSSVIAQTTTPAGNSTIQGRAIYQDTDRPVRRAPVVIIPEEGWSQSRSAVTDGKGEFTFQNLSAGQYQVFVNSPGLLHGFPAFDPKTRKGAEVTVDGTSNAKTEIRVERGGVITGKITYPDGDPAVGAQVNVFIKEGKRWSHAHFVFNGAQTDDRGVYRIYPLQPGEYVVSVIEQSVIIEQREGGTMQTVGNKSLTPYFYGDASTLDAARPIQVENGREVNNINITLAERATYKVMGTIVAGGKPLPGAYLRLGPLDNLSGPTMNRAYGISARADQDGHWVFSDVPDGTYQVELDSTSDQLTQTSSGNGSQVRHKFIHQPLKVNVAGADLSDLVMSLSSGGRISGIVTVEGDKPWPRTMDVFSESLPPDKSHHAATRVEAQSKGAFVIENVAPGDNMLTARTWDGQYFVKSITWNSKDILRQPLKVKEGSELKDVLIVLSADVAKVTGRVVSGEGRKPLGEMGFLLVPADELRWGRFDSFLPLSTNKRGVFKLTGAPGEYILLAQPVRDNRLNIFDFIRANAPTGTRVTLKPGDSSDVEIVAPPTR